MPKICCDRLARGKQPRRRALLACTVSCGVGQRHPEISEAESSAPVLCRQSMSAAVPTQLRSSFLVRHVAPSHPI